MARPRKPLAELMLSGTYAQNKARYKDRLDESENPSTKPQSAPVAQSAKSAIGKPPVHLTTAERKVWNEIVKDSPALTTADKLLLEVAVRLTVKMRSEGLKSAETTKLIALLEGFKGSSSPVAVADTLPTPAPIQRTPEEIAWDEFEQEMADLDDPNSELSKFHDERQRQSQDDVCDWIAERRAAGLWTDNKPKQEEKVEYTPLPPAPRPEPFEMDPARKQEQMQRRWSM